MESYEDLNEIEVKFRHVFNNSMIGQSFSNPQTDETIVNKVFRDMLGYSQEEIQNKKWLDFTYQGDIGLTKMHIDSLLSGKRDSAQFAKRYIHKNGNVMWGNLHTSLCRDNDGNPLYIMSSVVDITDQMNVEEALSQSESKYRRLHESMTDAFIKTNMQGFLLESNKAFLDMLSYSTEELLQLTYIDITPARWHEMEKKIVEEQVLVRGYSDVYEKEYMRKDGTVFPVELRTFLLRDEEGQPESMWAIVRDITERKREESVRFSELMYRTLVQVSPDPIMVYDLNGKLTFVSDRAVELFGINSKEEVLGDNVLNWIVFDDKEKAFNNIALILKENSAVISEYMARKADGSIFPVEVNSISILDLSGNPMNIVMVIRDISKRKALEEEKLRLNQHLQHVQKLESLGILAGGIAHDFNNILMVIIGNADLGLMNVSKISPARPMFEAINKASLRAADICRQMLAYSGKGRFVIQPVNLSEVVEELSRMLKASISKKVILNLNLAEGLLSVEADVSQIQQIIINLIINASEAMGDIRGEIYITTGIQYCDKKYLQEFKTQNPLSEGYYVYLEITDTGIGMDQATIAKIFDPFFSTKLTGRGLGLSAVQGIVHGHKGGIKVYSEPGKGSTFKILFPSIEDTSALISLDHKTDVLWKGSGTILLVDDEETIRTLGVRLLEKLGFDVLLASDGREALGIFNKQKKEIDCVLLDLTMPRMDGEETFRELRLIDPGIPIIMSSGYNEQDVGYRFLGKGLSGFIQKPYSIVKLSTKLEEILENKKDLA